jgi:hypothetical protein
MEKDFRERAEPESYGAAKHFEMAPDAPHYGTPEAQLALIDEVSLISGFYMRSKRNEPDVNEMHPAVPERLDLLIDACREVQALRQPFARAAADDGKFTVGIDQPAMREQAVYDFLHGPVSANNNDELTSLVHSSGGR